jgi:phytoene synthase
MVVAPTPKAAIAKGSKSFFLASLFFARKMRHDCWILYRWCRTVDDRIDNAPSLEAAQVELAEIRKDTLNGLRHFSGPVEYSELGRVFAKYSIPHQYAFDLIRGLERDATGSQYETLLDVEEYAYEVAGAVGLMMAPLMGANDTRAVLPAKSLGEAMQLTNIARDVAEDFQRGRIYLPGQWLKEAGIDSNTLMDIEQREKVFSVVRRLLGRAENLYDSGFSGLKFLSWRAALAVAIAGTVYREIGRKILRRGPAALCTRIYVPLPQKLLLVIIGTAKMLPSRLSRLFLPASSLNQERNVLGG